MSLQRIIREKAYHYNRKKKKTLGGYKSFGVVNVSDLRGKKIGKSYKSSGYMYRRGIGIRKLLGVMLVLFGVVLLFSRCFRSSEEQVGYDIRSVQEVMVDEHILQQDNVVEMPKPILEEESIQVIAGEEGEFEVVEQQPLLPPSITEGLGYYGYFQKFEIEKKTYEDLIDLSNKYQREASSTFAIWLVESTKGEDYKFIEQIIKGKNKDYELMNYQTYEQIESLYRQFIYDIRYFPINEKRNYEYLDDWGKNDNMLAGYGINILDKKESVGRIDVYSMSDGIVEDSGWSVEGGYRVGIRTPGGAYVYYGHLNEITKGIEVGSTIKAGEKIGKMGNSGGLQEGAKGLVPVQLHVGLAVMLSSGEQMWINPYPILRYIEANKVKGY